MSNLDTLYEHAKALADEATNISRDNCVEAGDTYKAAVDVSIWAIRCLNRINKSRLSGGCKPDPFDALLHRIETGTTTADDAEIVRQMSRPA